MSFNKMIGRIYKADHDFSLIEDGDRIAVGVSGGKDSLLLLYALHIYQKSLEKSENIHFDVMGIHLEMGFGNMDFQPVRNYMQEHSIPYADYPTKIYEILKLHPSDGKIQCSLCSKLKKGAMVNAARAYHCNKIAFAHHADDAIETLFLNMIYGGRIACFTPGMHLSESNMDFIRPLVYVYEEDIRTAALQELHLPVVKSTCPNDGYTKRQEVKDMLNDLYSRCPSARKNFLNAITNQDQLKIWAKGSLYGEMK